MLWRKVVIGAAALCAVVATMSVVLAPVGLRAPTAKASPSVFCHTTDGAFTDCGAGNVEWSDVDFQYFPASGAYLYADQADLDPILETPSSPVDTFVLMYDECGRTRPLGPDEYFQINFGTVEVEDDAERLEHYLIHVFVDGTITFTEDGEVQRDASGQARVEEIDGQRGDAGFGPSPNCPFDHVIVEFQIELSLASGHSYSPDPLFWSGDVPPEQELPPCPEIGTKIPVVLDQITGPVDLVLKPYRIIYSSLPLQFTSAAPQGGSGCAAASEVGALEIFVDFLGDLPPPPIHIGSSTTSATLDFFNPDEIDASVTPPCNFSSITTNCFVNSAPGPGSAVARWSSPGFDVTGLQTFSTGPLTYWINLGSFGQLGDSMDALVQETEAFIHQQLINHLPELVSGLSSLGVLLDPPADLLVTNPDWQRTGLSPSDGVVSEIPGSIYIHTPDATAVLLAGPAAGSYTVELIGEPSDPFSLSMSVVDLSGHIDAPPFVEEDREGVIAPSGTSFDFEVPEAIVPEGLFGTDARGGNLLTIDPNTGVGTIVGPMGSGTFPALAIDPTTGTMYAGHGAGSPDIYVVDPTSGAATILGNSGLGFAEVGALDFAANGTLFASVNIAGDGGTGSDHLARVDVATGAATVIGAYGSCTGVVIPSAGTGSCTIEGMEGIAFDANGDLWGVHSARGAAGPAGLYRIDETTGAAQFVSPIVDATGQPPSGGAVSIEFVGGQLFGGTASALGVADDGGRLITIDPETGTFTFVGSVSATGGNSLGALAAGSQAEPGAITDDLDGDGVVDELDNCPATPNADQADSNLNGTGDACEPQELSHESAAFLQANPDGTTGVEPTSLPLTEEPVIEERLVRIVQFRLNSGLSNSAPQLTTNLVDGLVDVGLVAPGDAANLVGDVLDDISLETPTPPLTQTGDANCNGLVNAVDAALILQFGAGLTASLPCRDAADVNGDGLVNAIDASLVLQFDAGLLDHLPP